MDEKVDVIGHYHVGPESEIVPCSCPVDSVGQPLPNTVMSEELMAVIA
jgi:hypothetical protein